METQLLLTGEAKLSVSSRTKANADHAGLSLPSDQLKVYTLSPIARSNNSLNNNLLTAPKMEMKVAMAETWILLSLISLLTKQKKNLTTHIRVLTENVLMMNQKVSSNSRDM
jgi:hypothetical protein